MPALQLVATNTVTPRDRICLYHDTLRHMSCPLESRIPSKGNFQALFEHGTVRDFAMSRFASSPHHIERTGESTRRNDTGYVKVVLQIKGDSYFEQAGRGVSLGPGDWTVYDMCRPYRVAMPTPVEILVLMCPRERVFSKAYNFGELALRRLSGVAGIGKLAYQFMRSTFDEIPNLDAHCEPDIVETIAHLIRMTMLEVGGGQSVASARFILVERIKNYISERLRDPALNIPEIAAALNCTKRYLHKVFEAEGVSLSDYIWGVRLDSCAADLRNPSCSTKSVTEIAFSWGFSSSAHFSTAFRKRFDVSPRQYREQRIIDPNATATIEKKVPIADSLRRFLGEP